MKKYIFITLASMIINTIIGQVQYGGNPIQTDKT